MKNFRSALHSLRCVAFAKLQAWQRVRAIGWLLSALLTASLVASCVVAPAPAFAGLNDDHFDGNIFALYAGNGSLVPAKVSLATSMAQHKPALMMFFVDDSKDCKQYSSVISQLQAFYGRAANFIPVNVDAIALQANYAPTEPGYYYKGVVPQTVIVDRSGAVAYEASGKVPFETVDDAFRTLFNLLPRSESLDLKARQVNEINVNEVNVEIVQGESVAPQEQQKK